MFFELSFIRDITSAFLNVDEYLKLKHTSKAIYKTMNTEKHVELNISRTLKKLKEIITRDKIKTNVGYVIESVPYINKIVQHHKWRVIAIQHIINDTTPKSDFKRVVLKLLVDDYKYFIHMSPNNSFITSIIYYLYH